SESSMIADSARQTASRRCSGIPSTSASWPVESTRPISSREMSSAAGVAVTPSLISRAPQWSESSSSPCRGRGGLELDRAVGQLHPREDTRTARDHVVGTDLDALAEHRAVRDAARGPDRAAGSHDAVAELAALADLGAVK